MGKVKFQNSPNNGWIRHFCGKNLSTRSPNLSHVFMLAMTDLPSSFDDAFILDVIIGKKEDQNRLYFYQSLSHVWICHKSFQ